VTQYLELALEKDEDVAFKKDQMMEFGFKKRGFAIEPKL
jgi:hypothetical protein